MDNKLLKSFITLAQSRSYREAAEKLFITQPALTKQINILEEELGFSLFERNNHGTQLSIEGKMLYKNALVLDEQINHFLCVAKKIRTGKTGNINIGYTSSFLNHIPHVISSFNKQYPNVNIKLLELSSLTQEHELLNGNIDIGFMRKSDNSALTFHQLGNDYLCLVTNNDISKREDISNILNNNNLILLNELSNPELFHIVNEYLKQNKHDNKPTLYQANVYNVLALVSSRMGVSILPYSIISFLKSDLNQIMLEGTTSEWLLGMSWNNKNTSTLLTDFIDYVKNCDTMKHNNI